MNQATMSIAVHKGRCSVELLFKLCAWMGVEPGTFRGNGRGKQ